MIKKKNRTVVTFPRHIWHDIGKVRERVDVWKLRAMFQRNIPHTHKNTHTSPQEVQISHQDLPRAESQNYGKAERPKILTYAKKQNNTVTSIHLHLTLIIAVTTFSECYTFLWQVKLFVLKKIKKASKFIETLETFISCILKDTCPFWGGTRTPK